MSKKVSKFLNRIILLVNRVKFHLFFKRIPEKGDYCNSRLISVLDNLEESIHGREYLAFIRCGVAHQLIDDGGERNFDIALNLYAKGMHEKRSDYEYLIVGGLNKYKAASQFINDDLLARYRGFIFLDDDIEVTYSDLCGFLRYCTENNLQLAQPSLTRDSYHSHHHVINASTTGWRPVDMVEVMCPYFSTEALKSVSSTFDLSYSTWGLDYIWPRLLKTAPAVVDEFPIRHTRPVDGGGAFYRYMREIGVVPEKELMKLKSIRLEKH